MQSWVVCLRSASGQEIPIGLVEASGEAAALVRARTKVDHMRRGREAREVVVHRAGPDRADRSN
jgi:hypothetical protein